MVVTGSQDRTPNRRPGTAPNRPHDTTPSPHVVWHDLECGAYNIDLAFWRELADAHPDGPILDVGAGTGRVALALARSGRRVIALDHDPVLLAALGRRAGQLDVTTVCADARSFALPPGERFALCIAPMQTVQLLGGSTGRLDFLRRAHANLLSGGLLACAILTELEPFDCTDGGPMPWPETVTSGEHHYVSQATRVQVHGPRITIERLRRIVPVRDGEDLALDALPAAADGEQIEHDAIQLDCLGVAELEREADTVGFHAEPARHIPPTADHEGSSVVMLRA
jgi:SAM-dependent methyltransferase